MVNEVARTLHLESEHRGTFGAWACHCHVTLVTCWVDLPPSLYRGSNATFFPDGRVGQQGCGLARLLRGEPSAGMLPSFLPSSSVALFLLSSKDKTHLACIYAPRASVYRLFRFVCQALQSI